MDLLWGECTWEQIAQAAREDYIVILPAGAIEQHGPMLPVDVDARIAERNARDGARCAAQRYGLNVLVLPTLSYGQSCIHMKFPGTISLRPDTYIHAVHDILRAAVDWGFRSLVVQNGNGGNRSCLDAACRMLLEEITREGLEARLYLHAEHDDPCLREAHQKLREQGLMPAEGNLSVHAAGYETAQVLADRPHLVRPEKMVRPTLRREELPEFLWRTDEISETGAFGDPSRATAEWGEALWKAWGESIAELLLRISKERGSGAPREGSALSGR